ncbi:hypothetical protein SteCoe_7212 [Stentor coeruleus]|uniref:Importin N-terminal domain-containing protein n=1 Tax=Stentor coeruleus TaxID=5963 RepID=A0A1R2CN10_9CILI|nr:hypothetical protein SteCoe_7212 [Stentor coeruleus]
MTSLNEILLQAQSPNQSTREIALSYLDQSALSNPSSTFQQLSQILLDNQSQKNVRILSAIYLKNNIHKYWDNISLSSKQDIKTNCLSSLGTADPDLVKVGAMAVSSLALKELPQGSWKEGLEILIKNAHNINNTYKHASLVTLGYICEDLSPEILSEDEKNKILMATLAGISQEETKVQTAALTAFKNSVKIFEKNFRNTNEGNAVLSRVYDTFAKFPVLVLQVLTEVLVCYAEVFESSLNTLGTITYAGINSHDENIVTSAIEVWNTIGDIEKYRLDIGAPFLGYLETACKSLTELLLPKLLLESPDDEWSASKAAYSMLASISVVCNGQNSQQMSRFIKENIYSKSSTKKTLAGLLALSSLYEESTEVPETFSEYFNQVIKLFNNPYADIKKTALWCFSRICKNSKKDLDKIFITDAQEKLVKEISEEGKSKNTACSALGTIFERYTWMMDLRQYKYIFETLVKLIAQSENYPLEYFGLMSIILEQIPEEYLGILEMLFDQFLNLYTNTLNTSNDTSIICITNTLQIVIAKLPANKLSEESIEKILNNITKLINSKNKLHEESLQLIGALSMNAGSKFSYYLPRVSGYLLHSITMIDSSDCIKSGIIAIGDIARSLGENMSVFVDKVIPLLFIILENCNVAVTCKVLAINCLGDIANATKEYFIPYMGTILKYLDGAAGASLQISNDLDLNDSLCELRESIVQFYVCLIQGLRACNKQNLIENRVGQLGVYMNLVVQDKFSPTFYLHQCVLGLIIDLIESYREYKPDLEILDYVKMFISMPSKLTDTAMVILSMCN